MSSEHDHSNQPPDDPRSSSEPTDGSSRASEPGEPLRGSMADLERELASLLDDAPLLPEDDEESDTDFEPPPGVRPGPWGSPPSTESDTAKPAPDLAPGTTDSARGSAAAPFTASSAPTSTDAKPPSKRRIRRSSKAARSKSIEAPPQTPDPKTVETPSRSRALVTLLVVGALVGLGWYLNRDTAAPSATTHQTADSVPPPLLPTSSVLESPVPARGRPEPSEPATAPLDPSAKHEAPNAVAPSALATTHPFDQSSQDAPEFDMVKMLAALAPAGIQAARCRRTNDRKGKVFVRVEFAAGGAITTVDAGHAYKGSETAACIERKIRAAKVPVFSGAGGTVVLPVNLK